MTKKIKILEVTTPEINWDTDCSSDDLNSIYGVTDWEEVDDEVYKNLLKYLPKYRTERFGRDTYYVMVVQSENVIPETVRGIAELMEKNVKAKELREKKKQEKAAKAAATKARNQEKKEKQILAELQQKYGNK
jgi:hypothetical protein